MRLIENDIDLLATEAWVFEDSRTWASCCNALRKSDNFFQWFTRCRFPVGAFPEDPVQGIGPDLIHRVLWHDTDRDIVSRPSEMAMPMMVLPLPAQRPDITLSCTVMSSRYTTPENWFWVRLISAVSRRGALEVSARLVCVSAKAVSSRCLFPSDR